MRPIAVVVEDEPDIRALIVAVLESSGYVVHDTGDGLEGVELVREFHPDVTTLDVSLPGIDGFETARRVREFSTTYIIFISAFVEGGDAERGRIAGGDEYLGKPFRPRELRARLAALSLDRAVEMAAPTTLAVPEGSLSFADVCVAGDALHIAGTSVPATTGELAGIRALVLARRRGATKTELARLLQSAPAQTISPTDIVAVERLIEALRTRLRDANSAATVESLHGEGYRLVEPA